MQELYESYEEPVEQNNRTSYYVAQNEREENDEYDENEQENYFSYTMERPRRFMTTRSVSQGRNDGRFTFNLGLTKPVRSLFKRIDNRILKRTTQNKRFNTETNPEISQRINYKWKTYKK